MRLDLDTKDKNEILNWFHNKTAWLRRVFLRMENFFLLVTRMLKSIVFLVGNKLNVFDFVKEH
jgi:hypothetical protein